VFETSRAVAIGADANTGIEELAVNVLKAELPLPRGKKKPSRVDDE